MIGDIEQGSEAWKRLRLGKATASRIADITAKTKTGVSALRATYMGELIAERLTGIVVEGYKSAAMERGSLTEADARAAYEFEFNCDVALLAFIDHPTIPMSGASPDGLVGDDGLVEFKAPNTATHIDTLLGGSIPGQYIKQMQWQMACTQRKWCDWVSYDNRLPENMRLFVKRVARDDAMIAELEREVTAFLAEVADKVSELVRRFGRQEMAA